MALYYDRVSDLTHVQFHLSESENVTDSLWARLSRYMHVRQNVLQRTMWDLEQQHYIIDFVVAGMPDWDKVRTDLGNLTSKVYYLGIEAQQFDNGSISTATFSEMIQSDCIITSPITGMSSRGILRIEMDGLGHARLEIYESKLQRLSDPGSLFVPLFESLGLPASVLNSFELNESLWLSQ
jgi:hypothetical protein